MGYDKRVRPNYGGKFSIHLCRIYLSNAQLGANMGLVRKKCRPQFGQIQFKSSYHTNNVKATHNFCNSKIIWNTNNGHKFFPSLASLLMPAAHVEKNQVAVEAKVWTEIGRKREELTVRRTPSLRKIAQHHALFFSFLGTAVTVGVTMFVLSISELSEVGMVRKKNNFMLC